MLYRSTRLVAEPFLQLKQFWTAVGSSTRSLLFIIIKRLGKKPSTRIQRNNKKLNVVLWSRGIEINNHLILCQLPSSLHYPDLTAGDCTKGCKTFLLCLKQRHNRRPQKAVTMTNAQLRLNIIRRTCFSRMKSWSQEPVVWTYSQHNRTWTSPWHYMHLQRGPPSSLWWACIQLIEVYALKDGRDNWGK